MSSQHVWFITGTSTGSGRDLDLVLAALKRGDKVIATARGRSVSKLDDLKTQGADVLQLDVTGPLDDIKEVAKQAVAIHGRIDVVVNNAGYTLTGAIEENTPEETYEQFNTNVFGPLNVSRAFLPYLRERKSGTIVFIGSLGGWSSIPNVGIYCATTYAIRGISTNLHQEIAPLGLRAICIDPGYFRTSLLASGHRSPQVARIPDYQKMMDEANNMLDCTLQPCPFGRELVLAALQSGHKVIATARGRSISKLEDLKAQGADVLEMDVTASLDDLKEVAKKAVGIHGRIDVVVNNAGYILSGAIEENSSQETFEQFNTNVFGALNVSCTFLPYMRERRSGTIVFVGSLGGWASIPNAGLYCSTKCALRGISTTLHAEIAPLGLRSICIDPGYLRTSLLASDHRTPQVARIPDYQKMVDEVNGMLDAVNGKQPGDPKKGVGVIVDVVRGERYAKGKAFLTVLAVGSGCYQVVKSYAEETLKRSEEWKDVTRSTDFEP